eukprot:CAMPEP_0170647644 /NCGR_PEP_ID=MMETSP0224-20130122/44293_1 /TAXON_ID=285029 /ORGANISM="Togula jolla, Strain CCCM 725" /LENGTH=684 /DNA_ID=CAMNT_0010979081 /DNA_START=22 /DNA_END=2073 /DNA_ORIENTATION=+
MTAKPPLYEMDGCQQVPDPRLGGQLLTASGRGLTDLVRLLLGRGADPGYTRHDGWTSLMAACSAGHVVTAELLLEHGADYAVAASDGFTSLMEACAAGHHEVVDLLLQRRAQPSFAAVDGTTPLILASLRGYVESAALLLAHRADASQVKQGGFSALRAAAGNGHAPVVRLLLRHQVGATGAEDARALVSAAANGHAAVVRLLLEHGVPATSSAKDGTSALVKACMANHREVAALLIRSGADVEGALEIARKQNLAGVRRVLGRLRSALEPGPQETRDLDLLVHEIEGLQPATSASGARSSRVRALPLNRQRREEEEVCEQLEGQVEESPLEQVASAADQPSIAAMAPSSSRQRPPVEAVSLADVSLVDDALDNLDAGVTCEPPVVPSAATVQADEAQVQALGVVDSIALHCMQEASTLPQAAVPDPESSSSNSLVTETAVTGAAAELPQVDEATAARASLLSSDEGRAAARLDAQLLAACARGLVAVASALQLRGADPGRPREGDGWTPLMAACSAGHLNVVEWLLDIGVDIVVTALDGFTPLLEACAGGHSDVVEALLRHSTLDSWASYGGAAALVQQTSHDGTTPLILAALHGHVEVAAVLLHHGAVAGHSKPDGFSALRAACGNGHVGVTSLLLEHGADASGEEGAAAMVSACANGHVAVARLLVAHGVSAVAASADGTT